MTNKSVYISFNLVLSIYSFGNNSVKYAKLFSLCFSNILIKLNIKSKYSLSFSNNSMLFVNNLIHMHLDFIVVIIKSDNEQFQKAQKKLITRLIMALLLFLIPTIVQVILQVFGITGSSTGGIK